VRSRNGPPEKDELAKIVLPFSFNSPIKLQPGGRETGDAAETEGVAPVSRFSLQPAETEET
jgi:hypothetical protein